MEYSSNLGNHCISKEQNEIKNDLNSNFRHCMIRGWWTDTITFTERKWKMMCASASTKDLCICACANMLCVAVVLVALSLFAFCCWLWNGRLSTVCTLSFLRVFLCLSRAANTAEFLLFFVVSIAHILLKAKRVAAHNSSRLYLFYTFIKNHDNCLAALRRLSSSLHLTSFLAAAVFSNLWKIVTHLSLMNSTCVCVRNAKRKCRKFYVLHKRNDHTFLFGAKSFFPSILSFSHCGGRFFFGEELMKQWFVNVYGIGYGFSIFFYLLMLLMVPFTQSLMR